MRWQWPSLWPDWPARSFPERLRLELPDVEEWMERDGMRIELIGFTEPAPERSHRKRRANEIGHSHLSFYVLDLDATLADLRAQGVTVEDATRTVLPSGVECCVVRDPDGFPIELVRVPRLDLVPYDVPYVPTEG